MVIALASGVLAVLGMPYTGGFARVPHVPSWPEEWKLFAKLSGSWRGAITQESAAPLLQLGRTLRGRLMRKRA